MKVVVPYSFVQLKEKNKEALLRVLNKFDTDEVFVGWIDIFDTSTLSELKKNMEFLANNGYKSSVWTLTLSTKNYMKDREMSKTYQGKVQINGKEMSSACPLCDNFVNDYASAITVLANEGYKRIILDDDFRMHSPGSVLCCFCDEHLKFYSEYLGKPVTREEMKEKLYGEKVDQKYKEAWMAGCRAGLEKLARAIRNAADKVDETIEIMQCAGPAHFGADGTSIYDISDILRGKNQKKEFRLIGGPYWANGYIKSVMEAYEFARQQAHDAKKKGYFTYAEGDTCPRPRYTCGATELEFMHTLMLADGNCYGIMKYGLDYTSSFDYDEGYADMHVRNREIYKEIEKAFSDKKCTGFHLVEPFDTIEKMQVLPEKPDLYKLKSGTRRFVVDMSLPTCYEPGGVNIIFGEHGNNVDLSILKNGSVLDITSARYLKEQGIDVGIDSVEMVMPAQCGYREYFVEKDDYARVHEVIKELGKLNLSKGAKVLSEFNISGEKYIGSYSYENANGERFLVYNFDIEKEAEAVGLIRNYYRQEQLVNLVEWLNGKKLDAISTKNPDLYILTKKNENSLAIGLWNHFIDPALNTTIELGEKYKSAKFINCNGKLAGDKVILDQPIGAYAFAFIELTK